MPNVLLDVATKLAGKAQNYWFRKQILANVL